MKTIHFSFLLVLLLAFSPAYAADPYTVSGVKVDVTAENAAIAKEKAIVEGQRLAFKKLTESQGIEMPPLSDDDIANMVRDFSVQSERTSGTRYVATLTYRFRTGPTRAALARAGIQPPPSTAQEQDKDFQSVLSEAQTVNQPESGFPDEGNPPAAVLDALILPIFDRGDKPTLWENPNPWRSAFQRVLARQKNMTVGIPSSPARDSQYLSAEDAVTMNPGLLDDFRNMYNAESIWIFRAALIENMDRQKQLKVAYSGLGQRGQTPVQSFSLNAQNYPSLDKLFEAGAIQALRQFQNPQSIAPSSGLVVFVPVNGLQDVNRARQALSRTGLFERIETLSVSREGMRLNLITPIDTDTLQRNLAKQGIILSSGPDGEYWLQF